MFKEKDKNGYEKHYVVTTDVPRKFVHVLLKIEDLRSANNFPSGFSVGEKFTTTYEFFSFSPSMTSFYPVNGENNNNDNDNRNNCDDRVNILPDSFHDAKK